MTDVHWEHLPSVTRDPRARSWLSIQANLGLAPGTIEAYGRALEDYLTFCSTSGGGVPESAGRAHIAAYVHDLTVRPSPKRSVSRSHGSGVGLANATLQQRLTAVRLYYDYLMEEGLRADNPVGRGRYTPGKGFGGVRERGLIPHFRKLPWIPTEEQWQQIVTAARSEPVRNRFMLALAYDAALRREELCTIEVADLDPAYRLLRIRAETTKSRRERVVPYSEPTGRLYAAYLRQRAELSRERGSLFRSESDRNRAQPISLWTWSKVIAGIAARAAIPEFTPHTLRHLRLTDLARADWDIHEIATFAGHRSLQSTMLYIHLSGRELTAKLQRSMTALHAERASTLAEVLP